MTHLSKYALSGTCPEFSQSSIAKALKTKPTLEIPPTESEIRLMEKLTAWLQIDYLQS